MEERKEWFTLEEAAEILRMEMERDGRPLTGPDAVKAVLKLVITGSESGNHLIPSYYFDKPLKVERNRSVIRKKPVSYLKPGVQVRGLWPVQGFPRKRFRYVICPSPYFHHPFATTFKSEESDFTGLLNLFIGENVRRADGKILLTCSGWMPNPAGGRDIGPIELRDPGDPEYLRVFLVPQAVKIGNKNHFIECVTIRETDLVISRRSLSLYAEQEGELDVLEQLAAPPYESVEVADLVAAGVEYPRSEGENQKSKGGRPHGYFREALEHVYQECHGMGNVEVLAEGQQQAFLKLLQKKTHGSGKKNVGVCEYIASRIEVVQPTNPTECVKTYELKAPGKKYRGSKWYGHDDVSVLMNTLRKKHPLNMVKSPL